MIVSDRFLIGFNYSRDNVNLENNYIYGSATLLPVSSIRDVIYNKKILMYQIPFPSIKTLDVSGKSIRMAIDKSAKIKMREAYKWRWNL